MLKKISGLFKGKKPQELIEYLTKYLERLEKLHGKQDEASLAAIKKAQEKLMDVMYNLKVVFYGEAGGHARDPAQSEQVVSLLLANEGQLVKRMAFDMPLLDFEAKKCFSESFAYLTAQYPHKMLNLVARNADIVQTVVEGYNTQSEVALSYGKVLRAMIGNQALSQRFLSNTHMFDRFIEMTKNPAFDVASDVMDTLKDLLTVNTAAVSAFMDQYHEHVMRRLVDILTGDNVIAKGWTLQLIWQLLTLPDHRTALLAFIGNAEYLKLFLKLIRDPCASRQLEAWNIVKLFVANDAKTADVVRLLALCANGLKQLLPQLQQLEFDAKKSEGGEIEESELQLIREELADEKTLLLQRLNELPAPSQCSTPIVSAASSRAHSVSRSMGDSSEDVSPLSQATRMRASTTSSVVSAASVPVVSPTSPNLLPLARSTSTPNSRHPVPQPPMSASLMVPPRSITAPATGPPASVSYPGSPQAPIPAAYDGGRPLSRSVCSVPAHPAIPGPINTKPPRMVQAPASAASAPTPLAVTPSASASSPHDIMVAACCGKPRGTCQCGGMAQSSDNDFVLS